MEKVFTCVIPARYKSSRFPGKILAKIGDESMISIIYKNATQAKMIDKVIVATDDEKIFNHCKENNINVMYTDVNCPNGSERVGEVAEKIDTDFIFEMQGDQPLVTAEIIDNFLATASDLMEKNDQIDVCIPYTDCIEESPDILKVVVTSAERLVFQTRQPIKTGYRTLGLYLWKKNTLKRFAELPVSQIEEAESSHPIRLYVNEFLVQGIKIPGDDWIEVDRPQHIQDVEAVLAKRKEQYD